MTDEPQSTPAAENTEPTPAAPEPVVTPAASPAPVAQRVTDPGKLYLWGTGRRKAAVARVRIRPGTGKFEINKRPLEDFFCHEVHRQAVVAPLKATENLKRLDVFVNVGGGGVTGQAGAVVLGVARALLKHNADYIEQLREGQYLTRDSRKVERKKYGQRGARRRFQFSKR